MTQCRLLLTLWLASLLLASPASANQQYNQGSEFAKGIKGQEQSAIGGFSPASALPSYTSAPPESGYYGGVTNASTDLTSQGNTALHQSEIGKTITESILNTPAGNKPSMDAPFISVGTDAQNKAESVTDGSFDGCIEQKVTHTEYTNHVCSRDTRVDQYCSRTASITGQWKERWVETNAFISTQVPKSGFKKSTYCASGCGGNHTETTGYIINFESTPPFNENITSATISMSGTPSQLSWKIHYNSKNQITVLTPSNGTPVDLWGATTVNTNDKINGATSGTNRRILDSYDLLSTGKATLTLTYHYKKMVSERYFEPYITWSETCPFHKAEGALTNTQCVDGASNKTIYVEGNPYTMYSDCWAYKDTYLTQSQSEGSCREHMNNPACTIANRQCAYTLDGFCLHENLTYSCEHKTTGAGVMCGGTFFCKDGSCAQSAAGKNNAFQKAVSQLAAVAAAGKDVAALNGADVRAFTGKAQFCKKFAAGFSNCCKDSGWGQDVGLASCSSEEKALGAARQRKLTIDIGEFCSKKVIGVCVEKKRSYCVFDSKLAQIVQQQGRQWQLGVGFGGASSPDCRGITIEQLQAIQFDNLDFSNFYEDLQNGSAVPEDNALLQRAQQQIKEQVNNHAGGAQ
ncbi:type-F conjugative transfer system mating-pair stabilization protein TraN [Aeromonas sp. HMWF014]|uniref:type-F conjugative transfer system mating-pair stabilization protein TraN n=1 Tax=Aeromonas sp. HMWF014 TaxID=2056850 RepID=UPI000D3CFD22|nr:type-F conjugative transfer system mating-pair stabilization protein TraN [Aeromonas sp. HMWF014]PTT50685.1 type-F conjugative transfer system mating-pair stabilization protein TraN [Aeromonas sp. HMWF014]